MFMGIPEPLGWEREERKLNGFDQAQVANEG
jgi:hypothetical protein